MKESLPKGKFSWLTILVMFVIFAAIYFPSFFVFKGTLFIENKDVLLDFYMVENMLESKAVNLLGRTSMIPDYAYSPLYHLIIIPVFILADNPILGLAYFFVAINFLSMMLLFYLAKKFFDTKVAVIALILYGFSRFTIYSCLHLWAPNLLPLLSLAVLFFLFSLIIKRKDSFLVGLLGALSISLQIHLTGYLIVFYTIVILLIYRPKIRYRFWFLGIALFFILYLPKILQELDRDGLSYKALFSYLSQGGHEFKILDYGKRAVLFFQTIMNDLVLWKSRAMNILLLLFMLFGGIDLGVKVFKKKERLDKKYIILTVIFISVMLAFILTVKPAKFAGHELFFFRPILFLSISVLLMKLSSKYLRYAGFFMVALYMLISFVGLASSDESLSAEISLNKRLKVVDLIIKEAQDKPLKIMVMAKGDDLTIKAGLYAYLFKNKVKKLKHNLKTQEEVFDFIYVILEGTDSFPLEDEIYNDQGSLKIFKISKEEWEKESLLKKNNSHYIEVLSSKEQIELILKTYLPQDL